MISLPNLQLYYWSVQIKHMISLYPPPSPTIRSIELLGWKTKGIADFMPLFTQDTLKSFQQIKTDFDLPTVTKTFFKYLQFRHFIEGQKKVDFKTTFSNYWSSERFNLRLVFYFIEQKCLILWRVETCLGERHWTCIRWGRMGFYLRKGLPQMHLHKHTRTQFQMFSLNLLYTCPPSKNVFQCITFMFQM